MPFISAATPFLLSLTIHFGSVVLSLPGYSATFHAQSEPSVAAADCRGDADGHLHSRLDRVCAIAPADTLRLAIKGGGGIVASGMWATANNNIDVTLPAGPVPPIDSPWVHRGGAAISDSYAISPKPDRGWSAALPRVWLSLREK